MDRISSLVSLTEARNTIDDLIEKVKNDYYDQETDNRRLLIIILSVIGGLVLVAAIAYLVYSHFAADYIDDYDDIDSFFDDEDEESEDEDAEEEDNDEEEEDDEPEVIYAHDKASE